MPERPPHGLEQARSQDFLGIHRHGAGLDLCEVVNEPTEDSSITALTWFSNSTGSTTRFFGVTRSSAELIGTASDGMSDTSRCCLSIALCPISPSPNCTNCG